MRVIRLKYAKNLFQAHEFTFLCEFNLQGNQQVRNMSTRDIFAVMPFGATQL